MSVTIMGQTAGHKLFNLFSQAVIDFGAPPLLPWEKLHETQRTAWNKAADGFLTEVQETIGKGIDTMRYCDNDNCTCHIHKPYTFDAIRSAIKGMKTETT